MEMIDPHRIRLDGGTQTRSGLREEVAKEYCELLKADDEFQFPAVVAFNDGVDLWMSDGFHRLDGYRQACRNLIPCEIRNGTVRDAILFSAGANCEHGIRRSNEDKRAAVQRLLDDSEWIKNSDRWIAETCRVSPPLVASLRKNPPTESSFSSNGEPSENGQEKPKEKRKGKDGKKRTLADKKLCSGCERNKRVGKEPEKDCKVCAELNKKKGKAPKKPKKIIVPPDAGDAWEPGTEEEQEADRNTKRAADAIRDDLGYVVPVKLRDTFCDPFLPAALDSVREIMSHAKQNQNLYPWLLLGKLTEYLKSVEELLGHGKPYAVHKACDGKGCSECRASGYVPEWRHLELQEMAG